MKKFYLFLIAILLTQFSFGQLTGIKTIPGDYATISAAITALNTSGVGAGGVTFNIAAGYTETITATLSITATGTLANPIIFQKSGAGANPLVTAYVGTNTPASAVQDGIWNLVGSDYVTIDGIDLVDPNTTNPESMEYGYGMFKASATDGCQNNTIKNCTVTLNRVNNAAGSGPAVDGSRAINVVNALVTAQTTVVTVTAASGANSSNKFYTNTLQNCNIGIALIGFADATPFTNADTGNDIGGSSAPTGNSILNFGGAAAATNPAAGVRTLAQYNLNVSYNTINNNNGSGVNHVSILRGIYTNTAVSANTTITYNTVTLSFGGTTSQVSVIENASGGTAAGNTINITNNTIQNCTNDLATTGTWYGIYNNGGSATNLNITNNTFTGNTSKATSGSTYIIYNNAAVPGTINMTNNNLSCSFTNTAAYTGTIYSIYNSSGTTATTLNMNSNNFSNYTFTTVTGTGSIYYFYNTNSNANLSISNNTWTNLTINNSGSNYFMYNSSNTQVALNVNNNSIVTGFTRTGASGTLYIYYAGSSSLGTSTQTFSGNNFSNITSATAGSGTFYMFYNSDGASSPYPKKAVFNNTFSNITYNTTGTTYLNYTSYLGDGSTTSGSTVYNNTFNNITVGGTVYGLYSGSTVSPTYAPSYYGNVVSNITTNGAASTLYACYLGASTVGLNFYKNKIFNIQANGATGVAYGMYTVSSNPYNISNNYVGDIKAPNSSLTAPAPSAAGIYVSSGTTVNLYYNTFYLNTTGVGANFGTAAVYASTTPTLTLRNNVIVNLSTPNGTGKAIAYQRSSTTLTTYGASSNNNNFYAGTPGANNLIFYDGTNSYQTLDTYKALVAPRDAVSVTENPNFVSTTGANATYLHINTSIATQLESGGANIATYTDDYDGDIRQGNPGYSGTGTAPDIGADEFNGIYLDLTPPAITYSPLLNTSSLVARNLSTTITDASGVPTSGIGLPRLYWRINSGSWQTAIGTFVSGSNYTFSFGAGVVLGDVVSYYVVAQDAYSTPNVACNPSAGASGLTANPPAAGTPPTTPNTYTIIGTICGTFNVGVGQTYTTLTAAITDLNSKEMSCAVTFLLTDASYPSETYPIVINANGGASAVNKLTIKPAPGIVPVLSGAVASGPLFRVLNSYTTIDGSNAPGGTTRNLTITNTSVTTPQVLVIGSTGTSPVTNSTLKNTIIINGVNSSSAVMVSDGAVGGTAGYFNNITIQNNSIQTAYIALYCISVPAAGNGSGLLITGNDFNTAGANSIRLVSIYVQGVDGATVSNNNIGNMVNTVDASNLTGIWFATATINSTISGNNINTMSGTSTGPRGIAISSGLTNSNITVVGNDISNLTTSSSGIPYGIYFFSTTTGALIKNNRVGTLLNSNTGGYGARGIYIVTGVAASNVNLINNLVYDVKSTSDASLTYWNIGMGIEGSTGGVNVYHNSVYLSGSYAGYTSGTIAVAMYIGTANTSINMKNNIFVNTYDNTNGSSDKSYAIYCATTNAAFTSINYNDYFASGAPGVLGYLGADQATLAAWQTATAQDANSINVDPAFVSATDLHPTAPAVQKACPYMAAVPDDFSGLLRTDPTDMGAYQVSTGIQTVVTNAATGVGLTTATLNGSITANNLNVTSGFEYGLTTAYGTVLAGVPATVTGNTPTSISIPISGLTMGTLYHFRAKGTSGGVLVNGNDLTFTTSAIPPTVVTTAATGVTATTATLNGTVNANGSSTTVTFDYGLTIAYGTTVPGVPSPVTGSVDTPVSAALGSLLPGTTYHFRVNGSNVGGLVNGGDLTFTTPALAPTVITTAATNITTTTATLNGTITANGASTAVTFEYGTTIAYGTTVPGVPTPVTGNNPTAVSANITGLLNNTTYHFRVNGQNTIGLVNGNDMTFNTNCPQAGPAGPITGPTQVCQGGSGYVYSVTIPNATGYVWTLPIGGTITNGANTNTITVSYAANAAPGYMFVYGTAPCGNGAPSQLAISMNPPAAPTITGPASVCVNSTGNVYSTQSGMSAYTWSVSAGGTITGGAGTNAITVTWNTAGAQTVSVNYNTAAGCPALTPTVYNVTVNPLPVPTITGPNPACSNFPGLVYSTQSGMTGYAWSISAGGTITAGLGTNSITVTWNTTGAQSVSVNYINANGCTAAAPVVYPVTVNSGAAPTITGSTTLCVNSGYYTYTTEAGMTVYTWNISSGGVINYGSGTNVITVSWVASGPQWVSVNYTNPGGCSALNPTVLDVTVNGLPGAAGSITGTSVVCGGENGVAYSVAPIPDAASYVWTLPAGATIASGSGTNAITVDFAGNASSGNITVYANNLCGNGTTSPPFAVTVNQLPADAGNITGPASVCEGATGAVYTVPPITGATGYTWTVPAGATIMSGGNTNSIVVDFAIGASSGNITVLGTNSCGNGLVSPDFAVTVNTVPATPVVTNTGTTLTSSSPTGNQWYYSATQTGTGAPIPGATGQTYVATLDGYYWSVVTINGCSSAESNHLLILTTGMGSQSSSSITIYPVPNDGRFNVSITSASDETFSISIYNSLGVKIYEETKVDVKGSLNKVIDLRPVPSGVYSVILENNLNQVVKKIVINK